MSKPFALDRSFIVGVAVVVGLLCAAAAVGRSQAHHHHNAVATGAAPDAPRPADAIAHVLRDDSVPDAAQALHRATAPVDADTPTF